jgi:hypothetical protein
VELTPFRLPEKRADIDLDSVGLPGGVVDVSLRAPLALIETAAQWQDEGNLADLRGLFLKWADAKWNLVDHQGPIPVTEEGFARLEPAEQVAICAAWLGGVVNPPAPLSQPSSGGEPSAATSRGRSTGRRSTTTSSRATPATPSRRSSRKTPTSS